MIKNILSIDLEDHFCDLPKSEWGKYESRVERTTMKILDLLESYGSHATFFTLGYVAKNHPSLIEEVKNRGHEIASHGYSHIDIRKMSKSSFETDLRDSLSILEKITGNKVLGYRAPWFSINENNFWVFDILKKYLKYDSSIFPVKFHYGFANAPKYLYKMSNDDPLKNDNQSMFFEIPPTTIKLPILGKFPAAGGIYLRFFPTCIIRSAIKGSNRDGFPAMLYFHPHDFDPNRPRLKGLAWHNFYGLKKATEKFETILNEFEFVTVKDALKLSLNNES